MQLHDGVVEEVEAEEAVLAGQAEAKVREKYNLAISSASRIGFSNDQALANERAGAYFAGLGGDSGAYWAKNYIQSSYDLYNRWEAFGKAKHLMSLYPEFLSSAEVDFQG